MINISDLNISNLELNQININLSSFISEIKLFYKNILIVGLIGSILICLLIQFKDLIVNKTKLSYEDIDLLIYYIAVFIAMMTITGLFFKAGFTSSI